MTDTPTYRIEGFEGPLDVLLTLIEKHKIDIYDIEISLLLEQYLSWMEDAQKHDLAVTADFLEMASRLIYIKSCSLLPKPEEDEEDPKWLLEQMLIEYAKYKRISQQLRPRYQGDKIFFRDTVPADLPRPDYAADKQAEDLHAAYLRVLRRHRTRLAPPKKELDEIVTNKFIAVGTKIVAVMRVLIRKTAAPFRSLFRGSKSRSEIVATFLALLELMRSGRVEVAPSAPDGDPEVRLVRGKKQTEGSDE